MSKNLSPAQEDMRIRRTKKLMWEALLSLLEKQRFASISVKAICEQAMVHRATFYSHFTDKCALLDYGLQEAVQTTMQEIQWNEAPEMQAKLYSSLLEYMITHQRLFSLLLLNNGTESFSNLLLRRFVANAERQLARSEKSVKRTAIPTAIRAQFYAGGFLQVITWWVEQEVRVPSRDLADYLQQLLLPFYEQEQ